MVMGPLYAGGFQNESEDRDKGDEATIIPADPSTIPRNRLGVHTCHSRSCEPIAQANPLPAASEPPFQVLTRHVSHPTYC